MNHYDNKTKRALAGYVFIFFLLVMGIVASGYLSYHNFETEFHHQAEHQISAIAELKVNDLVNWRKERLGDAKFLYHNPAFSALVERYFESPSDIEAQAQLLAWLGHYQAFDQYDRVRLLDVTGAESLTIPAAPDPFDSHLTQDALACLRSGEVTFLDFHRNTSTDADIHLSILVPIFAGESNSRPLGVLVLRIDPKTYLYPYVSQWPIPSSTAETLLVRRDGEDVLFLNELRFGQDAPLTLRFPLTETNLPAVKAVLGQTGLVEGVDYRGESVLADMRAVPDSPWFLVSKMDTAEVHAPLRARLWQTLGMIGMAIFAAGAGLALAWRQQRILFYRTQAEAVESLRKNEEKYRRLFDNAVLGIFQSTPAGKAISVNVAFAHMFGYDSPEDAIASIKNVGTDIFADPNRREKIIRLMAENPNLKTFENLYRRKDGSTFFGSLNTMPIRDSNGNLILLEGIIEDITERKQAEESLNAEQNFTDALMDNVPVRIYFKDRESRFIRVNNAQSQLFGLSDPGQAVGKTDFDFFSDEHAQQAYKDEQEIIRTGQPISKEEKETRDGLPDMWVSTSKLPLRDKDGKIIGTFGISVDITERKQVEDALKLRETYLTAIIENQPGLVWLKDINSRFLVVNSAFALSCGKQTPEDVSGKTDLDIWPKELAEKYRVDDAEVIKQKTPLHVEEFIFDQGQAKWFETFKIPIIDETGQVIGTTGFARDITERKQAEEALRESEEKYRRLYDHAPLGIFQSTLEGKSISINPAFARMHGYESPEDVLKSIKNIATDVFADPNRRAEIMRLMKENPDLKTFENVYRRKDGSTFIGNLNMMLIRDPDGRVVRVEGIVEDITMRKQAEDALQKSEESLRLAVLAGRMGTWDRNFLSGQLDWSVECKVMFGLAPEVEMNDELFMHALHPDDREPTDLAVREALEKHTDFDTEYRVIWPDGTIHWIAAQGHGYYNEAGQAIHMAGVTFDITERKQAEQTLRDSQQLLQAVMDNIPQCIFWKDSQLTYLGCNRAFAANVGLASPNDIVGKTDWDLPSKHAELYRADDNFVMKSGIPKLNYEEPQTTPDGAISWLRTSKVPMRNVDGNVYAVLGLYEDITERKRTEEEIIKRSKELASLNELGKEVSGTLSLDKVITAALKGIVDTIQPDLAFFFSRENERLILKRVAPELNNSKFADLPEHRVGECLCGLTVQEKKPLYSIDIFNDFRCTWLECKQTGMHSFATLPLFNAGEVIGVIGLASYLERDFEQLAEFLETLANSISISMSNALLYEQVQQNSAYLEQRVRERTVQLEATNKELEAFSYSVSHDLRAPLRGIDGWSQALLEDYRDKIDEQGQQYINRVRSETQRMGQLIDDMLKLSRLTRAEIIKEKVDLSALAQTVVERLKRDAPLRQLDINIQSGLMAEGDPHLLETVLVNLLENALKFTGNRADARIEFGQTESQGQRAFFVRDNGAGFDMAYSQKLFGAFQRMHKASEFPGTGVGLAIVQRVIHRHGGRVWAEAEVGHGATFYFTLA